MGWMNGWVDGIDRTVGKGGLKEGRTYDYGKCISGYGCDGFMSAMLHLPYYFSMLRVVRSSGLGLYI